MGTEKARKKDQNKKERQRSKEKKINFLNKVGEKLYIFDLFS